MFEQAFKNIDDILWKEAGCTTELDYTEQTSWLLFLKYLDGLEQDLADEAALEGRRYSHILDKPYRWESWAAPKGKDGKLDHNKALTGDDLRDFVNQKLVPYLHGFKQKASGPNTIEYKIGEIFGEIKNKIQSGYNMREIIDHIDVLRFRSQVERHELSQLYEAKIKNMGNAGRNGGDGESLSAVEGQAQGRDEAGRCLPRARSQAWSADGEAPPPMRCRLEKSACTTTRSVAAKLR
jgi:type I restriction enzyme M protein